MVGIITALLTSAFLQASTAVNYTEVLMTESLYEELEMEGISEDLYNHSILTMYGDRIYITDDEIALMERCVMSEAGGQSIECQEAVATVILNRWQHPDKYPDTIEGVIMDPGQFSTHDNGKPTVSVRVAVHNAIVYYNTAVQDLPSQIYYFRSGRYHDFGTPYECIDDLYFSGSENMLL